eukprot:1193035-Prorocentrum_minimum.AAC.2
MTPRSTSWRCCGNRNDNGGGEWRLSDLGLDTDTEDMRMQEGRQYIPSVRPNRRRGGSIYPV